ncbi:MAG: hypothetical protein ACI809_001636, partial [Candidatus Azotimanducaceae bacterium]
MIDCETARYCLVVFLLREPYLVVFGFAEFLIGTHVHQVL